MKNFKRILSLTLALLMVLAMVACGKDPVSTQGTKPSGSSDAEYDFGGRTIKIATWAEGEKPELGDSDSEDAWYYSLKHAAEKYNCKIEWIIDTQENHFNNFIQKSLAGEVYADIFLCHSWNYVSLIQQGLLQPTTSYIENAPDKEHWSTGVVLNDELWCMNPIGENYFPTYYYLINTKLLGSLGLEHPQELAKRGEWTWDKFREYCAAATDPSIGQYGVGCFMLAHMLKNTNDFDYTVIDENGVYRNAFTYPGTKDKGMEVLEMVQVMSQEDKSILGTWTDGMEAMNETLNAFKDGKLLFAYYPTPESLKNSGFTDYSIVTLPLGPSSQGLVDTVEAFSFWSLPTYSNFTADERAAFWMEAKCTWDESDPEGYYVESREDVIEVLLDKCFINRSDVEFMLDMGATMTWSSAINVSWGPLIADDLFGAIIRGDTTPAAVIEELDGEIQSIIDATYNKNKK